MLSNGWSEMWSLTRDVLEEVVERFPDLAPKLEKFLVAELQRKSRLYALSYRILIGMAEKDPERRSALILQKAWTRFATLRARSESRYSTEAQLTSRHGKRVESGPSRDGTPEAMQAALREIQTQLLSLKRDVRSNGTAPPGLSRQSTKSAKQTSFGSEVDA